ncbi:MAG: 4-oxalocrotonate tautomerase family protein [Spirochaetales bacterium]|nr:4-oxalocrotonate tautomerase family protein [Spirochaetales bacterium]
MPNVTIDGPEISDTETKRRLVVEVTDALEKAYGLHRDAFVVIIKENAPENVGVGGRLLADRQKQKG